MLSIPLSFFLLIKLIKKYKPSIVHTWMYHADLKGGMAARIAGCNNIVWGIRRTSVTDHKKITHFIMRFCALLSYVIPKKIVCVATASKYSHARYGYNAKKMVVIPNGFDFDRFNAQKVNNKVIRDSLGFLSSELIIGCVGRFHPDKGQDVFIKAVSILKDINNQNLRFLLIGRNCDQNNIELMNLLNTFGLTSSFILLGEREDIPECLAVMDIFCMPSRTEGFPNGLVEAMSMGLPCIATDVGDVHVLVGNTSVLVAPNDPAHIPQ